MQGLDRVAKIKTRYGGRYVRAVDGLAEHGRRSWFYYVNGYLADQGSAEYRLRDGDVEWWDYRSWRDPLDDAVVVGAWPEPFRHGYGGERRKTVVVSFNRALGRRIAAARRGLGEPNGAGGCQRDRDRPETERPLLRGAAAARSRLAGALRPRGGVRVAAGGESGPGPLPVLGAVSPAPAAALLAGLVAAALLADRTISVAAITLLLLLVCLRAPAPRRRLYLVGAFFSGFGVFVVSPFVASIGSDVLWSGPTVPVLGQLDVTREELHLALFQGAAADRGRRSRSRSTRSCSTTTGWCRPRALRDGRCWRSRLRPGSCRRWSATPRACSSRCAGAGWRWRACADGRRLVSPLLAGSLERALNLAEAMEARGYGRPGGTRSPKPGWGARERLALALGVLAVVAGALWL